MKKLLALFLAFVMLAPMALIPTTKAEGTIADAYTTFEEDFDSYPDGQMTNHKLNLPQAWNYGMVGGTSNIRDKALVLTGTVSYQNITIPGKIIVAEAYAKEQTWELTVTIPEGLDEDAEIQLFRYEGKGTPTSSKGKTITDLGVNIKDYTLYYTQLLDKNDPVKIHTEEKSLCTLNPGTYTFKRVLDMNDSKNFKHSVFVVDESGKEIAKIQNVDCPEFTDITGIFFGTSKANEEVIFDDYKIYASGVAANLFLFDEEGKKLNTEELHSGEISYRLAWRNATDKAKTYILMAAYYDGDEVTQKEVLAEITLEPGEEGVETGTVETEDGQKVKLYLRDPAQERAARIKKILLIAAGVVALVVVVIVLIILVKILKKQHAKWKAGRDARLEAFMNCDDVIIEEEEDE